MRKARIHMTPEEMAADDTASLKEIMLRVEESLKSAIPMADAKKIMVKGRDGKPGESGRTPQKGVDYFTEEELNAIKDEVYSRITPPKDGFTPTPGVHYPTFEQIQAIVRQHTPQLPPKETPEEIVDKVNESKKKIKPKQVEGLVSLMEIADQMTLNIGSADGKAVGGGKTLRYLLNGTEISQHVTEINFSTNITPTYAGNGRITLTATGGAGYANLTEFVDQTAWRVFYSDASGDVKELAFGASGTVLTSNGASSAPTFSSPTTNGLVSLTATGSINGSNVTFTFTSVPNYIVSDGIIMPATAAGGGVNWTNSGTTITMVNPPAWDIYGLSNIATDTTSVVYTTGNQSIDGTKTFVNSPLVPDDAYGVGWNGNTTVPTKNAVYDKIESLSPSGGMTWSEVTGTSQAGAVNNGYIVNNASQVVVTIPDTAALGSVIRVVGKGAGGWRIAQNASENINFGSLTTTTGTGGYIESTHRYDAVEIVCTTANTTWNVISVQSAGLTIV